jgi:hypothetical protein
MAAPAWAMAETTAAVGFDSNLPRAPRGRLEACSPLERLFPECTMQCGGGDSSGVQQNLIRRPRSHLEWLPSCFLTTDLRPEPTVQLHLLPRLSCVLVLRRIV